MISFFDSFYVMPFSDLNQQEEVLRSNVKRCVPFVQFSDTFWHYMEAFENKS